MITISSLVIDDEPLARSRIVKLLKKEPAIAWIGECANGHEALQLIEAKKPDLIFLDVEMPEIDGFGVLSQISPEYFPFVVFVTAYDHYALKAFDVRAVDYLLKPFEEERFFEALSRAKSQIQMKQYLALPKEPELPLFEIYSFVVQVKSQSKAIPTSHIYWLEARGNYSLIHLEKECYPYRITMDHLEGNLKELGFLRIHRSSLLNTGYIRTIRYLNNNEYKFTLANGQELVSGRSYQAKIKDYLKSQ